MAQLVQEHIAHQWHQHPTHVQVKIQKFRLKINCKKLRKNMDQNAFVEKYVDKHQQSIKADS